MLCDIGHIVADSNKLQVDGRETAYTDKPGGGDDQ